MTSPALLRSALPRASISRSPALALKSSATTSRRFHLSTKMSASAPATEGFFRYIDPSTYDASNKPWSKVDSDVTSFQRTNTKLPVYNIRGQEAEFGNVDVSGFAVHRAPTRLSSQAFDQEALIRNDYYAEVEQILRSKLQDGDKVKKVVIFDHTIRKRDKDAPRGPVQQIHVDQTPAAAETRVRRHIPSKEEAEELLKGRYQLINVWRPISHPASDTPLAVIDWRTTSPNDVVAVDLLYPKPAENSDNYDPRGKEVRPDPSSATSTEGYEIKGETYAVAPNDKHRLYYYKDMTPEEIMFIKCFDSWSEGQPDGKKGVAALTPHTAFVDPNTPKDAPGRQSIEVRALVFYE